MKLQRITLKNFRGYSRQVDIPINQITALIGRNDIGKSTILDALDTFFNQSKMDVSDRNIRCEDEKVIISCVFSDYPSQIVLDEAVQTSLESEYLLNRDGLLEIRKEYAINGKESVYIVAMHPSNEPYDNLIAKKNTELRSLIRSVGLQENVNLNINSDMRKALWESLGAQLVLEERLISADKEDAKNIWQKLIPYLPKYSVFKADRPSTDDDALAQDPMQVAMKAAIEEKREELSRIAEEIKRRVSDVADRTIEKLKDFDEGLASMLTPQFKKAPAWDKAFLFSLTGDEDIPLNKRGSGVRRLVLFSFFRASFEENLDGNTDVIYAVEEPETSQHPDFQKTIITTFMQMVENPHCQIILTTHVPGFAKMLPVDSIRYITNGEGYPEIELANDGVLARLSNELGVLPDLTPPLAPYRPVRLIVCVEGPNDVSFLYSITDILHCEQPTIPKLSSALDVITIPLGGDTLQNWVNRDYLRKLGIPEYHIYDSDCCDKHLTECNEVNARGNGSSARMTSKREMENYIHSNAIFDTYGIELEVTDDMDVPKTISAILTAQGSRGSNEKTVKRVLNKEATKHMSLAYLNERDPNHEVLTWVCDIFNLDIDDYI